MANFSLTNTSTTMRLADITPLAITVIPELPVEPYLGLVYSVCRRVLRHASDVDDAVQETFIKFARQRDRIATSVASWLHACARTTAIDVARGLAATQRRQRQVEGTTNEMAAPVDAEPSLAAGPAGAAIDECIAELAADQRDVVIDYFWLDKTLDQIAQERGLSKSGVKKRLDKTVVSLRKMLARRGIVLGAMLAVTLGALRDAPPQALAWQVAEPWSIGLTHQAQRQPASVGSTLGTLWKALLATLGGIAVAAACRWSSIERWLPRAVASATVSAPAADAQARAADQG